MSAAPNTACPGADRAQPAGTPDGDANILPRSRPDETVVAHVSPSVAVLLAALAAERGVSVAGMIAILAVDAAEALGLGKPARSAVAHGGTAQGAPRDG